MPHISTHVLDVSKGKPAAGIQTELRGRTLTTNAHGRTDEPLLAADALEPGTYELTFHVGDYLRASGQAVPFYETISVRFAISDGIRNYHVPLLLSPYGYSTYLGS
jgi:5-hydroxyisourate hydrolase